MRLSKRNKIIVFLITFLFIGNTSLFGQFTLGVQRNLDFYKPYTVDASFYISKNENVNSHTSGSYLFYSLLMDDKNSIQIGINHKLINHQVLGRIKKVEVIKHDSFGNPTDTSYFNMNGDLITVSNSFGASIGYSNKLFSIKNSFGQVGFVSEVYLFEMAKSSYRYEESKLEEINNWSNDYAVALPRYSPFSNFNRFFLSSVNFSTFYKHVWQLHDNFSLAARVSIGTNLYSDWDQFRKYVWMGVGLELGFGPSTRSGTLK